MHSPNAVKANSTKGDDSIGVLRVEVMDSGVGIGPENHHRVFGEFSQFKRNEHQGGGGSGLGLWISKQIVEIHKGKIGFESQGGGLGSMFFFELPLYSEEKMGRMARENVQSVKINMLTRSSAALSSSMISIKGYSKKNVPRVFPAIRDEESAEMLSTPNQQLEDDMSVISCTREDLEQGNTSPVLKKSHAKQSKISDTIFDFALTPNFKDCKVLSNMHIGSMQIVPPVQIAPPTISTPPLRILIVDDSGLNRKVLVRQLESETFGRGDKVVTQEADDGLTAIETMRAEAAAGRVFDIVLMDYIMVSMHGPEAVSIIRKDLLFTGSIIGITGNALPDDINRFKASGADAVLTKPLARGSLIATIRARLSLTPLNNTPQSSTPQNRLTPQNRHPPHQLH